MGRKPMGRRSEGLGERHRNIMTFLKNFQDQRGYSPSIREIGRYIGVESTSLVDYYLEQLCQEGYIERDKRVSRSIRILQTMRDMGQRINELLSVPMVGRIGASLPVPMPGTQVSGYYDSESTVEIARSLLSPREKTDNLYALEVQGMSMIDAMVSDGDIIIMRKAESANNGEMVAVWLEDTDETTLKYFFKEDGRVRLQPANPTMNPIIINNPERLRVQGKVVMIVRRVDTAH
jgi:repressor LexA